eukprot:Skav215017  [mRNA]  locus=scaffold966:93390:93749:- [translate_table: standard]
MIRLKTCWSAKSMALWQKYQSTADPATAPMACPTTGTNLPSCRRPVLPCLVRTRRPIKGQSLLLMLWIALLGSCFKATCPIFSPPLAATVPDTDFKSSEKPSPVRDHKIMLWVALSLTS